jgi:hypothetical protein
MNSAGRLKAVVATNKLFFEETILNQLLSYDFISNRFDEFYPLFDGQSEWHDKYWEGIGSKRALTSGSEAKSSLD